MGRLLLHVTRRAAPALVWFAMVGAAGCKGDAEGRSAPSAEVLASQEKASAEEDEILKRRDALLNTRLELRTKRAELAEKRNAIRAEGGDTSEIDKEAQALLDEESGLVDQEKDLNAKLDSILSDRRAMVQALTAGGDAAGAPGREAAVAAREKDLARREQKLGEREAALAAREESLATKWKDSCGGGGTTTIVQTIDAKGSKYTKNDVAPLLARARAEMNDKGILKGDLPEPVRDLENEATAAMAKGDYGQAHFAAQQLLGNVKAIKIDKAFIAAKIGRLNAAVKGKALTPAIEQLFREATENVADGKFKDANRRLNKIFSETK
jgi:hypothetical protein